MVKKQRTAVDIQKLHEREGTTESYERYVSEEPESELANPDLLPEQNNSLSSPQLIMGEAIEHLQGRQKEVYLAVMREDKSLAEAGEFLGIGKSTARVYLDRAIKFITAYCEEAVKRGRI